MLTQDNPNDINCYVAPGGTGNGMSAANAFGSIADAIDYIKDLDSVTVIQLACDHYIFHYESERIAKEIKIFIKHL